MNLTNLEYAALHNLLNSDYDGPAVWAWCAVGGSVTNGNVGGVVSSLSKKGLVFCEGRGRDAIIGVTDAGRAAYDGARRVEPGFENDPIPAE